MTADPDDGPPSSTPGQGPASEPPLSCQQRVNASSAEPSATDGRAHGSPSQAGPLDTERFVAGEELGKGGSSIVIRAFDKDIRRDVAIKILKPELAGDAPASSRFAEEARITGQLEHPNIAPVYELSFDRRGQRFLSMKLVKGDNLQTILDRLGPSRLEPARLGELLQIFVKVCDAVSFAHSRGVIHRDLKPLNIMVSDFGQVYVVDWGIARLREPDVDPNAPRKSLVRMSAEAPEASESEPRFEGTVGYMPPEQIQGSDATLDERSDVFALGATLYQILTGPTEMARAAIYLRRPLEPPDRLVPGAQVPPELSRIALRAMSYAPADRYASVEELKRDVESFQRGAWDLPRTTLAAGTPIIAEGDRGDTAYVILEGQCLVYHVEDGEEVQVRVMGPGDAFGETAVFSDKPRTASVKALTDVVLITVTREVLSRGLGLNSWMGAFVKALADRFRQLDERLRTYERAGRPPASRP